MSLAGISSYFKTRLKRGLSLKYVGPNEARLVYDFTVACGASVCAIAFSRLFLNDSIEWWFALAPPVLLALNAAMGIYTALKMALARIKALIFSVSVILVCGLMYWLTRDAGGTVVWGLMAWPSLVLARIFLAVPHSNLKNVVVNIVKQWGPVLITGGAGYIGTTLVDLLLKNNYQVRILDRLMYGRGPIADFEGNENFSLIEGDATDISKLTQAIQGAWAVVHLAGIVGDPACALDPKFTRQMNIISTGMVKSVAHSMGVSRLVFASSCSVYGVSEKEATEDGTLNPVSLYAQTKIDSENELLMASQDNFFITILRFATVFGHARRARFDLVGNLFTAQAMNEGLITVVGPEQWRPFVHVRDIARAILAVLQAQPLTVQNQIFNVGDKRLNMTILQLAETVKRIVEKEGRKVNISVKEQSAEDKRNYRVSFDKISRILGYQAENLMEPGIQEMVDNFKNKQYADYRASIYNNALITKQAVDDFYDPMQSMELYAPLQKQ